MMRDHVAAAINANSTLQDLDMVAVSDGVGIRLRSTTGHDIQVEVTGGVGDSVDVSTSVDGPETVSAGQGTKSGRLLDVQLSNGLSVIASNSNVFNITPACDRATWDFWCTYQGNRRPVIDSLIEYNTGGVSDNRNALALVGLENKGIIGGGVNTYSDGYPPNRRRNRHGHKPENHRS